MDCGDPTKTLWHIINSWPCVFDFSISISQGPFVSCGMCGTIFLLCYWAQVMFARLLLLLLVLPTDARRSLAAGSLAGYRGLMEHDGTIPWNHMEPISQPSDT